MNNRIIDLSDSPARLSVRYRNLVIETPDRPRVTLPLADIAVLVVSHPEVRYSQAVLSGLVEAGGVFITCNDKRLPNGMLAPLQGHTTQAQRFAAQAAATTPLKKRAWRQIVRAKILAQGRLLQKLYGNDRGLANLAPLVKSGDPANIEARAARRYWQALFADPAFRRERERLDQNRLLNYGYAVLRAIVARAVCGAGLHPSLGVHHHNRYSAYCLADDLMEPLRPVVDAAVVEVVRRHDPAVPLTGEVKRTIIAALTDRYTLAGEQRTVFEISTRMATSLAEMFLGRERMLKLPSV